MKHFSAATVAFGIMLAAVPAARAAATAAAPATPATPAAPAAPATAATTCPPDPTSTVNGNLIVPPGASCRLSGVTVTGNVQVQTNAFLGVFRSTIDGNLRVGTGASLSANPDPAIPANEMTVDGNVEVDQCSVVIMVPVQVGGNVNIQNCTRGAAPLISEVLVEDGQIAGNFDCSNNSVSCSLISSNVNGNVQINDNGAVAVVDNTIAGNLQCQGNAAITDEGQANTVGGRKQGQCAGF